MLVVASLLGFQLIGILSANACSLADLQDSEARSLLRRALKKQRSVDFVRIETRPGSIPGSSGWTLKVQTVANKGIKVTIVSPLTQAGVVSIDDAHELKTFLPDDDTLLIQPSPVLLQPPVDWRLELIDRNYRVKMGEEQAVAGQEARILLIEPVREIIPTRKMYVDPKHDVVLKYVVEDTSGRDVVIFDTKTVMFGRQIASEDFALPKESENASTRRRPGPVTIKTPSDSKTTAGFSTRVVEQIPYGFKSHGNYLFKDSKGAYVATKLSDGMATLTIYQWKSSTYKNNPSREIRFKMQDSYGISIGISTTPGDHIPDEVLERIVESFVKRAE